MRNVDETRRTDIYIYTYIYIYIYIYRKFSPVVRLGGLAPARPIKGLETHQIFTGGPCTIRITVRARRTMGGKYEQQLLQYAAGCYSSIVAAFIANRLPADSLVF